MNFWLIFFHDQETDEIFGTIAPYGESNNYHNNPYYIGKQKIKINLEELEK